MEPVLILRQVAPRLWNRIRGIRIPDPGGFVVCHSKSFMFVPIMKSGSTTLIQYVLKNDFRMDVQDRVHYRLGFLQDGKSRIPLHYARKARFRTFTKFAVYRDPVERFVSLYNEKIKPPSKSKNRYFHACDVIDSDLDTFIAFAEKELEKAEPHHQDEHLRPQHLSYTSEDVDYVVPIDRLDKFMRDELGCEDFHKRLNPSPDVSVSLSPRQENRIRELYAGDYQIHCSY